MLTANAINEAFGNTIANVYGIAGSAIALNSQVDSRYVGTSLESSANILSGARYTAMLDTIQNANALANNLSAMRYEAMYQSIKSQNQQTNDLAAARYAAMQQYYTQPAPQVVVNVAGNVTAESDLVATITDQLYQFQKNGGQIQLSALAV